MYVLANFQFYILKTTALQVAETERSICTQSMGKNKLQAITIIGVTYKWNDVQT